MKILMLGWEYPPHISGGLATACHGMVQGLIRKGHEVVFIMPRAGQEICEESFRLLSAHDIEVPPVIDLKELATLKDMIPGKGIQHTSGKTYDFSKGYGTNLIEESFWFAVVVSKLVKRLDFDIIHAHDWLTFPAGLVAKKISRKSLVVHVHATEFDRSAKINSQTYGIERRGMLGADKVMAVSNLTRNIIVKNYDIDQKKVITTYNGVVENLCGTFSNNTIFKDKIVTFLGRVTYQKGPEYFIEAAEKVLKKDKGVRFVMAGSGDLLPNMIQKVAAKRLSSHFHFTGFLEGKEVRQLFAMSDVFVMPSVSEPFGIAPLEAIQSNVPVIISRQSGVSEVLPHALLVDYWDTDNLAEAIHGLLYHTTLAKTVRDSGKKVLKNLTWDHTAAKVSSTYRSVA